MFVGGRIVEEGGPELAETWRPKATSAGRASSDDPRAPRKPGRVMTLDVARIRKDFPILDRTVRGGQPLIYLDSANTSQKPRQVIDALTEFYERHNANIHRATHELGEEATEAYEGARIKAAQVHRRRRRDRGHLHQEHLRGHQPRRVLDGQRERGGSGPAGSGSGPATRS